MNNIVSKQQSDDGYDTDTNSVITMRGMTLRDLKNKAVKAGVIGTTIRNRYTKQNRGKLIDDIISAEKLESETNVIDITPPSSVSVSPIVSSHRKDIETSKNKNIEILSNSPSVPRVWKSSKDVVDDEIHEIPPPSEEEKEEVDDTSPNNNNDDTYTTLVTVITLASTILIGAVAIICAKFGTSSPSSVGRSTTSNIPPKTTEITRSMLSSDM